MADMKTHRIGVILNGVTGRMGTNQHLMRSLVEIIRQGGVKISDDETILPDPILAGRSESRLEALAARSGVKRWTTRLDEALSDPSNTIYFDSQITGLRAEAVRQAFKAGKHVYCEKPTAATTREAYELFKLARKAGLKHGVVQDKLWLPGLQKLKFLLDSGFFGRILSVRGDFGYWVFEGDTVPPQRPSWNYRKEDGGGIIVDMFPHWRYVLDNLFGAVQGVFCLGATHVEKRWDERGRPYHCTADDSAYAIFELEGGIIAQFNSSWTVRVRRDDLVTFQVDGDRGTAVAGLRDCWYQPYAGTPRPVWNPDQDSPIDYRRDWSRVPDHRPFDNAFKVQWELFLRHVVLDEPFPWDLLEGAKGLQLAESALESWKKRSWVRIPALKR